jgi:hypothetical protein
MGMGMSIRVRRFAVLAVMLGVALVVLGLVGVPSLAAAGWRGGEKAESEPVSRVIEQNSRRMLEEGKQTFGFDTFGSEQFFAAIGLHKAIEGSRFPGGIGGGVSPRTALAVGLKVDVDALPGRLESALKNGRLDLDDPAVTLELLRANAVVGLTGFFNDENGRDPSRSGLKAVGIQCALCHATVDDSVAPGVGRRLDGWANQDLNVGVILGLAPNLTPVDQLLGVDDATLRKVLASWGPGKFDAEVFLDGKAFRPDGKPAATLIPSAYGLAGHNNHTWTGAWGTVTYWNAFVANLEMHGTPGTFFDPRLDNAAQYPIAARNRFGHLSAPPDQDRITPKLAALHFYQLAIPSPKPPADAFDRRAAERGKVVFDGPAKCATCHVPPLFTEPGWNLHTPAEVGIDSFQADRAPDHRYRTAALAGRLFNRKTDQGRGFYHDGRFKSLLEVVNHYNDFMHLGLSQQQKNDLIEYLKSI